MTMQRSDYTKILQERNLRDEQDRISRIKEITALSSENKLGAFFFDMQSQADLAKDDPRYDALAWHLDGLWNETCWSYVWGLFRGTIVLAASTVETGLKYRLLETGQLGNQDTLGASIKKARLCGILPSNPRDPVVRSAILLNTIRNDLVHANKERSDPESSLSGEGTEHETIDLGDGVGIVIDFRFGARDALKQSRLVLTHLAGS